MPTDESTHIPAHASIAYLAGKLGYIDQMKDYSNGLCKGISTTWMKACLSGDERAFDAFIKKAVEQKETIVPQIDAVKEKVKHGVALTDDEDALIEMGGFFDSIALHQSPVSFEDVFDAKYYQDDVEKISPFTQSKRAEGTELSELYSQSNIYSEPDMAAYFSSIAKTIDDLNPPLAEPVGLVLDSHEHTISVTYDAKSKSWTVMDINLWPPKVTKDPHELVSLIRKSEGYKAHKQEDMSCFKTQILAQTNDTNKEQLEALKQSLSSTLGHSIKTEHIDKIGPDSLIVILKGDPLSAKTLAEQPEARPLWDLTLDTTDVTGSPVSYSAAYLAATYNQPSVIEAIAKLPDGTAMLAKECNGLTPADRAFMKGYVPVIRAVATSPDAYTLFNTPSIQDGIKLIDRLSDSPDIEMKKCAAEILLKEYGRSIAKGAPMQQLVECINQSSSVDEMDRMIGALKSQLMISENSFITKYKEEMKSVRSNEGEVQKNDLLKPS